MAVRPLDTVRWSDKTDHVKWRNFGLVGLLALGVAGCSADKPASKSTTAAVVETTVAASVGESSVPVSTQPQRIPADYRIPIIINAIPKTDLEREALDAAPELLVRLRRFQLLETKDSQELSEVLSSQALSSFLASVTGNQAVVGVPSSRDRLEIESIAEKSSRTAALKICLVDGATVYEVSDDGQMKLDNANLWASEIEVEITRTLDGWRITNDDTIESNEGVDKCER